MKNLKVTNKSIIMILAILTMLNIFSIFDSSKVYATENEANLNEILEVYNNTEDLPDGMVLAPNPNADDDNLNTIFDVYDNADLEDGEVLAPAPNTEQILISPNPEKNISPAVIIAITVVCAVFGGGIIFIIKKRK